MHAEANTARPLAERWLRLTLAAKPRIYRQVAAGAEWTDAIYWLGIIFSSAIATLGLVLNSPAVIIGAMLISPLMSPIMSLGLGTAIGDMALMLRACMVLLASLLVAVAFSASLVWLLPFHSVTDEILSRTHPTLLDLAIAIVSGLAGSVAAIRAAASDESTTTLPGVAIAVALMPPLCTVGFGLGNGFDRVTMGGAALLFLTNLVAIVASAFLVFLFAGMRTTKVLESAQQFASNGDGFLSRTLRRPFFQVSGLGGKVHLRGLVLLAMLVLIAVPLKKSLSQVVSETRDRNAIQEGLRQLGSTDGRMSQNVTLGAHTISVDFVTTTPIAPDKLHAAEKWIEGRTGKTVRFGVTEVASRSELQDMLKRLADTNRTAVSLPPPPQIAAPSIDTRALTLRSVVGQKLVQVWPADIAKLEEFSVELTDEGIAVQTVYSGRSALDKTAVAILEDGLRRELQSTRVTLVADQACCADALAPVNHRQIRKRLVTPS